MKIELTILGEPKAQKRHRTTTRFIKGKLKVRQYDPSAENKNDFLWVVQNNAPKKPLEQALRVTFKFYFTRPKNHFGTGKSSQILKEAAPTWHTSKPDNDNLQKFCMDALNKVFWKDDSYISESYIVKKYCSNPRIEITIETIQEYIGQ